MYKQYLSNNFLLSFPVSVEIFHKAVSKVMLGIMLIKGSHIMKTNTVEKALPIFIKLDIRNVN